VNRTALARVGEGRLGTLGLRLLHGIGLRERRVKSQSDSQRSHNGIGSGLKVNQFVGQLIAAELHSTRRFITQRDRLLLDVV
jgi:hypothetical protein